MPLWPSCNSDHPHPATLEPPSSRVPSALHTTWTTLTPLAQPLPCLPFSYDFTEDLGQQLLFVQTEALCVDLLEDCWRWLAERATILYTWGNDACYVTASTRHTPTPHALCAKLCPGHLSCCGVAMVSSTWRFTDVEFTALTQHPCFSKYSPGPHRIAWNSHWKWSFLGLRPTTIRISEGGT